MTLLHSLTGRIRGQNSPSLDAHFPLLIYQKKIYIYLFPVLSE